MRKLLLLAGACALLAGCGGGKHPAATGTVGANGCITVDYPITGTRNTDPPTVKLNDAKHYDVTFNTSCGNFTIRLDPAQSPSAAASLASLVQHRFFDTTVVHRMWLNTLIQAGDPSGSGTGGPGYSTVDKVPSNAKYTRGVVAMAKTADEPAGTAGSQFFIVTAKNAGLTADYAIVGVVIKGMDVVDRINQLGNFDQTPSQTVEINSADLKVSG
jgi:peptidyl-prolyl cis-trans isomerase B (cyclophilin B)